MKVSQYEYMYIYIHQQTFVGFVDVNVIDLVSARRREGGDWLGPLSRHGGVDWYHCGGPASWGGPWQGGCGERLKNEFHG